MAIYKATHILPTHEGLAFAVLDDVIHLFLIHLNTFFKT